MGVATRYHYGHENSSIIPVELKPFSVWSKNRSERGGGGISTAVAPHLAHSAVGAGEGQGEDEYLVTRLEAYSPPLTIINCYGEQRKVGKEVVEETEEGDGGGEGEGGAVPPPRRPQQACGE